MQRGEATNPYTELYRYIHPLVIGTIDRANSRSVKICDTLLAFHIPDEMARWKIAETLATAFPAYDYPIFLPEARRIGLPAVEMDHKLETTLTELECCYGMAGRRMRSGQEENRHHDEELPTIIERAGRMIFFRYEREWYYRTEERQWMPMNVVNAWLAERGEDGEAEERRVYIR